MVNETQLEEELQGIIKLADQLGQCSIDSEDWPGTKEQLYKYLNILEELDRRGWIELKKEPYHGGELYLIKVTTKGYVKAQELKER